MKTNRLSVLFLILALGLGLVVPGLAVSAEQVLVIGSSSEPRSMDPYFHNETPTNALNRNTHDCLTAFDTELKVLPGLAEKWENPDNLTWVFHLRKGVKFHNGDPFTAEDVKFSIERCKTWEKSGFKSGVAAVDKVEVVDPLTAKFTTKEPFGILPRKLAQVMIMSKKFAEQNGADYLATHENGTGPYVLKEWVKGDHLTLAANENYWAGPPAIKTVTLRPLTNDATRTAAILSGEVHIVDDLPVRDVDRIKANKDVRLVSRPGLRLIYLQMDQDRPDSPKIESPTGKNPLMDTKVRQALFLGIDEDAIVKHVMNGFAFSASQFYPSAVFGFDETIKRPAFDPAKAKALLAEAGYPNGFTVTLDSPNDRYVNDEKISQAVAASLAKIGLTVKVNAVPKATFFPLTDRRESSFFLLGWSCGDGDASAFLDSIAHTFDKEKGFGRYNRGRYSNPKADKLIEAASATVNQDERLKAMVEAQKIIFLEDFAFIPLHFQVDLYAASNKVKFEARADHYFQYFEISFAK